MAHRYSQSFSASEAYSPRHSLSTAPILHDNYSSPQRKRSEVKRDYNNASDDANDDDDDESEDWNVYDDFNNARPRPAVPPLQSHNRQSLLHSGNSGEYKTCLDASAEQDQHNTSTKQQKRQTLIPSDAFGFDVRDGDPQHIVGAEHPTNPYRDSTYRLKDEGIHGSGIELITVPALGAEYTNEEIKAMKKPHKRRSKARQNREKAQKWVKSEDRYCGCLSPRIAVFILFGSLAALAVMLYFVIPRVPIIAVQTVTPLTAVPDGASMQVNHRPTNFSMDMKINLRADNTGGWVPTRISKMQMNVWDISTSKKVGEGTLYDQTFPGRKRTTFQFPASFSYASINATGDDTWLHWINACGPQYENTARQSLNLQFSISMDIKGLIGSKGTSAQLADLACPFTLQSYQT